MRHAMMIPAAVLCAAALLLSACDTTDSERTVLYPVPQDPTISFSIQFRVGAQNDPPGKEGLAWLTGALISEGATTANSYEQILEKLYPMAAGYGVNVDKEVTTITGRVHADNLDAYYTLLMDAVLRPAFTQEDFERVRTDALTNIEKTLRYSNDEELGKAALYDMIFAGTPYGHLSMGTVESLSRISVDDVRSFFKTWYTRGAVITGLGGGYDDALLDRLTTDLATLPEGTPAPVNPPVPKPIEGLRVRIIEKECDATAISFGFPIGVVRGDADFYALALFNSWFGEHRNSSSHLYQVIREQRGMNYGDYSYIEIFPNGGRLQMPRPNNTRRQQLFEVWIRPVQHAHRHFALRAALRELTRVIEHGMTAEQFEETKTFLRKYALHYAPTTAERLGYAMDSRFYGIRDEYIELFRERIGALTLEQVNAAIRKHLQVRNVAIAMVSSDAAALRDALAADAPSPVTYDTPKDPAVLEEDKQIAVFPLAIPAGNIEIIPVESMFAK